MRKQKWILFYITPLPFLLIIFLIATSGISFAEDQWKPGRYKLRVDSNAFYKAKEGVGIVGPDNNYSAGAKSTFYIYGETRDARGSNGKKGRIIKFKKIRDLACEDPCDDATVNQDEFFVFYPDKGPGDEMITLNEPYYKSSLRIEHGVLVVPFKFRTNDGTLSGESSVGYYIGAATEWLFGTGTGFITVGLSRIAVTDVNQEVEYKTGVTYAAGVVFKDIDNFQVALVVGADHLGGNAGKDWDYEDDAWISFGVGYNFATEK